jgi:hypothetical protein
LLPEEIKKPEVLKIRSIFDIFLVWKTSDFFRWINTVLKDKEANIYQAFTVFLLPRKFKSF